MSNQKITKPIAIILVAILMLSNISLMFTGSTVVALSANLENQQTSLSSGNLEYDVYFKDEGGSKTHTSKTNLYKEDTLYVYLKVSEGYLKETTITLNNPNFKLIDTKTSQDPIASITDNSITLNNIRKCEEIEIALPIKADIKDEISVELFSKETEVKIKGLLVKDNSKTVDIEKTIKVRKEYTSEAEVNLEQGVIKFILLEENNQKNVIMQTKIKTNLVNSTLPIEKTVVKTAVAKMNEISPKKIYVTADSLEATNGKSVDEFTEDNWKEENGIITIQVANPISENKITWKKDKQDEYIITYIYGEDAFEAVKKNGGKTSLETMASISAYNLESTRDTKESKVEGILTQELNNISMLETITETEINKGNMYTSNGTEYKENIKIDIAYEGLSSKVSTEQAKFQAEEKEYIANSKYKTTKINKQNFLKMLGEEGFIKIYNNELGNVIATITKDTETDEKGNLVVNYETAPSKIMIETSKSKTVGKINIENTKEIYTESYNKETIKTFTGIKTNYTLKTEYNEKEIVVATIEAESSLKESISQIETQINQSTLSSIIENQNIEIRTVLKTSDTTCNLYSNPQIKIQLPEYVEKISFNDTIKVLFTDEFEVEKAIYNEETKQIEISLKGTQTKYNDVSVAQGPTIVLNANIRLSANTPAKEDVILTQVTNEDEIVEYKTQINYFIPQFTEVVEEKTETEGIVMPNTEEAKNSVDQNSIVTENVAVEGVNVPKNEVIEPQNTTITENTLPQNVTTNNTNTPERAVTNTTITNNTVTNSNTQVVTGKVIEQEEKAVERPIQRETSAIAQVQAPLVGTSNQNLSNIDIILTSSVPDGTKVKEGDIIKYTATVTNTGNTKLENVEITIPIPEGTTYRYLQLGETYNIDEYILDTNTKEFRIVKDIEAGKNITQVFEVQVNQIGEITELSEVVTVKQGENQSTSNIIKNPIEEGTIAIELTSWSEMVYDSGNMVEFVAKIKNVNAKEKNNIKVTYNVPTDFSILKANFRNSNDGFIAINQIENTIEFYISNLSGNAEIEVYISLKINEVKNNNSNIESYLTATLDGTTETISSNKVNTKLAYGNLEILHYSNLEREYVNVGDEIIYYIMVKNTGNNVISGINIKDILPEELEFIKGTIQIDNSDKGKLDIDENNVINITGNSISKNSVILVEIHSKVKELAEDAKGIITLTNKIEVESEQIKDINVNDITFKIKVKDQKPDDENKTYTISGVAWLDKSRDGIRDTEESLLKNINVTLITKETAEKVATAKTNKNGEYTFEKVKKGEYIVVFEFDTTKYEITKYELTGANEGKNSDAALMQTTFLSDGKTIEGAVTNTIVVDSSNIYNIDLGLIESIKADLKLDKKIAKITVQNTSGTKTYDYTGKEKTLAKIEIPSKQVNNTTVVVEYLINVTNEGNVPAFAKQIVDYLPVDLKFQSELNSNWFKGTDGNIYTKALENEVINPGESKAVKLVLVKNTTENNLGTTNNSAEIYESYNEYGVEDIDSKAGNKISKEDDYNSADLIISINTGTIIMYVTLTISMIAILGVGIYMIKKKVLVEI